MSSILIVEDDSILRELLFELFSEEHTCSTVEIAEDALARLDSERFDVVLTDISMPGMSGLELLGHIRQRWPEMPVIVISGIRDKEYAEGLVRMGAFDYLVKPFELLDVKESVDRAIEQHRQPEDSQTPDGSATAAGKKEEEKAEVFSSIQLDKVFSLCELLAMVQRSRMSGYIQLRWAEESIEEARRTGKFKDAAGNFDEALQHCSGVIYLHEGLIIDAAIANSESSPYWRDAEQSLVILVRLATWAGAGLRAWGFAVSEMTRDHKLAVSDNSGKLFSIITADEEAQVGTETEQPIPEEAPEQAATQDAPQSAWVEDALGVEEAWTRYSV
jgi:CheY-like chemotaxis protein